jgi:hypothetical protein
MLKYLVIFLALTTLVIPPSDAVSCQVLGVAGCSAHCKVLNCAGGRCVGPFETAICTCYRCANGR